MLPFVATFSKIICVIVRFPAQPCDDLKQQSEPRFPSLNAFSEVPMMGFEPIPRFSRERILSPLRLPFRHIGNITQNQRAK
jgi:hypothetical protein